MQQDQKEKGKREEGEDKAMEGERDRDRNKETVMLASESFFKCNYFFTHRNEVEGCGSTAAV